MKGLLLVCCLCAQLFATAQQKQLSGSLTNSAGRAVPHVTVMLRNERSIVGFANSTADGRYTIAVPDTARFSSLHLEINGLGYKKLQQPLTEGKYIYDLLLEEKVIDLPEVKISSRPQITTHGDTLSYNVSSFAREEDRTIGDVIRRLPGIAVGEDGKIFYNGKAILNLYIHGDDLMSGNYGLATKTITKDMIRTVDVMQNFQPIKVLKDRVFTDDVGLNLVLEDENSLKLSGQGMLGAGVPEQFDAAATAMLFNKKFKMINSLKANNSGVDYRDDLVPLSASDIDSQANMQPSALLSAGTVGNPSLPRTNYYFNRSAMIHANNLVNTKTGWQLRSNIHAFSDRNTFRYKSAVDTYLAGDTIHYTESQSAIRKPFLVNSQFTATANKSNYYILNSLRINLRGENNSSDMDFNGKNFQQRLRDRVFDFSNNFNWTPLLKTKSLIGLQWYLNYYNSPQRLDVDAGLNADVLNNNLPYASIGQQAATPTVFSNASASYSSNHPIINQNYSIGIINERQNLNSDLQLTQLDGNNTKYTGDPGNALRWRRDRAYLNSSYYIRKNFWQLNLAVPVVWQYIRYQQEEYNLDTHKTQFFTNPSANLKLILNAEDYLTIKYAYNNNVGNISGIYRGTILSNYRSLRANDADLQESSSASSGVQYNFQRSIIMLFVNAGLSYNKTTTNSILSSVLTDNVQRTVLLPYENEQQNVSATAGVSKYLFGLKTTASLKSMFSKGLYSQFINGEKFPFVNSTMTLSAGIETRFLKRITFSYEGITVWNKSRQDASEDNLENKMKRLDQSAGLGYSPVHHLFLTLKGRHIYSTQANTADINYIFLDTKIRYKLVKWRVDLECDVTNIANVKNYEVFLLNANQFAVNQYAIRNRMAILRATFNL